MLTRVLGWLGGRRAVLPLTARLLCARTVRETQAFFVRELVRPRGVRLYTLRENGLRVAIRHRSVDAATLAEIFYHRHYDPPGDVARALGEPRRIVDLGANIGLFGAFALGRWPGAHVVAYEPDPANVAVHERTVAANGLAARWTLVRAAAGAHDGEVRFAAGLDVASHSLEDGESGGASSETISVPLRDVLPELAAADLVKVDIEGGEWAILRDPRLARRAPRALALEYHPRLCADADPRAAAEHALVQAGLRTAPIWHAEDGHGMLWAWRSGT
jgi:FkbM family methyltransferase